MKLKAFWYMRPEWTVEKGNVGDIISPYIIEKLSGEFPDHEPDGEGRTVTAGSLMKMVKDGDIIWGTGAIKNKILTPRKNIRFHAVRGPLTRKILIKSGYDKNSIPEIYGDPAVLTGILFPKPRTLKYRIGVIPHYVDIEIYRSVFSGTGVHLIEIINSVDKFLDEINSCEIIMSSSLHGIIISESYGINAIPLKLGDKIIGDSFKFDDYYASTGRKCNRINIGKPVDDKFLERLVQKFRFISPNINRSELLRSCPFYFTGEFDR
jgi:pyruvyltransferase